MRRLLPLLPLLALPALSRAASAAVQRPGADEQPEAPLIMPLRRGTKPLPSSKTAGAAAADAGDHHRSLRGKSKTKEGADGPATKGVAGLKDRRESKWGFFATIKFDDGQDAEALADTGSMDLWLPSTLCPDCNKALIQVDRTHPDLSSIRPVPDPRKAQATFIDCNSDLCVGSCTTEMLAQLNVESAYCGPHGGYCANLTKPETLEGICAFGDMYMDGSLNWGVLVQNPAEINGIRLDNVTWGALIDGNTNTLFQPGSGGTLGLQPSVCDFSFLSCYPSFLDTVASEKGLPKIVSYCGNEEAPVLVVGGTDARLAAGPVQYTPLIGLPELYTIEIESATFGGEPLPVPEGNVATADTGTSLAFIPQSVFDAMQKALQSDKFCGGDQPLKFLCKTKEVPVTIFDSPDLAVPYTEEEIARFPTLTLTLPGGPTLELKGQDYMTALSEEDEEAMSADMDVEDRRKHYTFGFVPSESKKFFLLGQLVLRKFYTEFDVDNKRMGFAPAVADCQQAVGL